MTLLDKITPEMLADLAAQGLSRQEVADHLGVSYPTIHQWAHRFNIRFRRPGKLLDTKAGQLRTDDMAVRYQRGETLEHIGASYGVTRERVRQILTRTRGFDRTDGGISVGAASQKIARQSQKDKDALLRWGCTYDQYRAVVKLGREQRQDGASWYRTPVGAFASQKCNARARGIEWRMTFWQWWTIWQQSGRWDERGRGHGFVMCRNRDAGAYSPDNVVIAPAHFNSSDQARKQSGLPTGVSLKRGRYVAIVSIGGVKQHLGVFPTPEDAHQAYLSAIAGLAGHKTEAA